MRPEALSQKASNGEDVSGDAESVVGEDGGEVDEEEANNTMKITICHFNQIMELSPEEAIEIMTDEWIDGDNYCDQTVMDMRDCIKQMLKENKINW